MMVRSFFENIDPEKIYSLFITKGSIVYENKMKWVPLLELENSQALILRQ